MGNKDDDRSRNTPISRTNEENPSSLTKTHDQKDELIAELKRRKKISSAPPPAKTLSGISYVPPPEEKKPEKQKIVKFWINAKTLMERWNMDASDLANFVFNFGLKAWDMRRAEWIDPEPKPYAWMAGPGTWIKKRDLSECASQPIEDQKDYLSRIVKFDLADVEEFEKEHPEINASNTDTSHEEPSTETHKNDKSKSYKIEFPDQPYGYEAVCLVVCFYEDGDKDKKPIRFEFTELQTKIFKLFYEKEGHRLSEIEIKSKLKIESENLRMRDKFRNLEAKMGNDYWKKLFIQVKRRQKTSHWELNI